MHSCWRAYRARGRFAKSLPVALLGTGLVQAHILNAYPTWSAWLTPVVLGGSALGAGVLLALLVAGWLRHPLLRRAWLAPAATGLAIAALLVAPAVWSGYSVTSGFESGIPAAGPQAQGTNGPFGGVASGSARRTQDGVAAQASAAGQAPAAATGASRDGQLAPAAASGAASVGQAQADSADAGSVMQQPPAAAYGEDGGPAPGEQPGQLAADGGRPSFVPGGGDGQPGAVGFGGPGGEASAALIAYLEANQGSASYLVATMNSNSAASIIVSSGRPVMSLGGFSGDDPILTVDQFASLVQAGEVRYVLLGGGPGGQGSTGAIAAWVQANGTPVSASAIGSSSAQSTQLYDLGGVAAAAAAAA
ncbi:MAG: hypothetical protein JO023_06965 [Chloroflexi bacterium]|nr:hypothetical protein [Chloroflexota bacterium]